MTDDTRVNKLSHFLKQVGDGGVLSRKAAPREDHGGPSHLVGFLLPTSTPPNPKEESFLQETPMQEQQGRTWDKGLGGTFVQVPKIPRLVSQAGG